MSYTSRTMNTKLIFFLSLLTSGVPHPSRQNLTFLPQLQELCPYTSFCEQQALASIPDNGNTSRPCCRSCSCKPECEVYGNCCFDSGETDVLRKCTSPLVSRENIAFKSYIMIYSCSRNTNQHINSNKTLCEVNNADFKSFAPVLSTKTGDIFVNAACAFCNNVNDIIPWKIAVECRMGNDDYSFNVHKLLQGENAQATGCRLAYVPPSHAGLKSRECLTGAIRECNVTGLTMERTPFWDYCPMFNATYSQNQNIHKIYANIFCYLCNAEKGLVTRSMCKDVDHKNPIGEPFMAILDGINVAEEDAITEKNSDNECGPTEALVQSFKTECRRILCPWGQFRVGGKCGYYSKEWIGGPFTVVLKLTPMDRTKHIDMSMLSDIQPSVKYNEKARWLKRNAMKAWNFATLYRPSIGRNYVEYLVAMASYPSSSVNPSKLRTVLRRTLEETWQLIAGNRTIRLSVELNRYERYVKQPSNYNMMKQIYEFDEDYVFINMQADECDTIDQFILPIFDPFDVYTVTKSNLNELFLCDQIELSSEEFRMYRGSLVFTITNETLSVTQYSTDSGNFSICLNRFGQNRGSSAPTFDNYHEYVFVGWSLALTTIV